MFVLDTNIIIYYLQGNSEVASFIDAKRAQGEQFTVSAMSVVELFSYPQITAEEIYMIERWLKTVLVVEADMVIAREAARLRRSYNTTTVDSLIAATALLFHADLITNDEAFYKIKDIKVISL